MRQPSASYLVIRIPEGVDLAFPLAGASSRFLAWLLDLFVIIAISLAAGRILSVTALFGGTWQQAVTILAYFALSTGYPIFFEWFWRGQTVGKRLFHLRVMDAEGRRLTFAQVVIRNIVRLLDLLPVAYLVGAVAATFSRDSQRLGDLAAGTIVVIDTKPQAWRLPDLEVRFNSLLAFPHLISRVRYSASRELVEIATMAILRRDQLSPEARVQLFEEIRRQFSTLASFPESATEHLASEQYVRNILAAVSSAR